MSPLPVATSLVSAHKTNTCTHQINTLTEDGSHISCSGARETAARRWRRRPKQIWRHIQRQPDRYRELLGDFWTEHAICVFSRSSVLLVNHFSPNGRLFVFRTRLFRIRLKTYFAEQQSLARTSSVGWEKASIVSIRGAQSVLIFRGCSKRLGCLWMARIWCQTTHVWHCEGLAGVFCCCCCRFVLCFFCECFVLPFCG